MPRTASKPPKVEEVKEELDDLEVPNEGEVTGIYRLTMKELDKNLLVKKAARTSARRLIMRADSMLAEKARK